MKKIAAVGLCAALLGCGVTVAEELARSDATRNRGPRVRVELRQSGEEYEGHLVAFSGKSLELDLADGKRRVEDAANVRAVRFLTPQAAPVNDDPFNDFPAYLPPDALRLRKLRERSLTQTLSPEEKEELQKLKERLPLIPLPDRTPTRLRLMLAESSARFEKKAGTLDEHVQSIKTRLVRAFDERQVRDALIMLIYAYKHKGWTMQAVTDQVRTDAKTVDREDLKAKSDELVDQVFESMRNPRGDDPFDRHDRDRDRPRRGFGPGGPDGREGREWRERRPPLPPGRE